MAGVPALRERIAVDLARFYGRRVDPETEITITSGATEAIFDAIAAVVRPGDEVIVLDPATTIRTSPRCFCKERGPCTCHCSGRRSRSIGSASRTPSRPARAFW